MERIYNPDPINSFSTVHADITKIPQDIHYSNGFSATEFLNNLLNHWYPHTVVLLILIIA